MVKDQILPRTVRGKRPRFFDAPGTDESISMVIALAQEVAVLRERLDSVERIAARHGIPLAEELEGFEPDGDLLAERESWRQRFFDRLFFVFKQQRSENEARFTSETYDKVIADVARGE